MRWGSGKGEGWIPEDLPQSSQNRVPRGELLTAKGAKNSREDREKYNGEETEEDAEERRRSSSRREEDAGKNEDGDMLGFFANFADFLCDLRGERLFLPQPESTLLRSCGQLTDGRNEGAGGAGQGAVATVGNGEFAPEFLFLGRNQFHAARQHLVAGEAGADQ